MNTKSPVYTRTCQDETRAPPLQLTQVTPGIPFSSSEGTTSFTYVQSNIQMICYLLYMFSCFCLFLLRYSNIVLFTYFFSTPGI